MGRLDRGRCGRSRWLPGVLEDEEIRRGAERDAGALKGLDDATAEFAEHDVLLIGSNADDDGVGDGAAVDLVDARDGGVGDDDVFHGGVCSDSVRDGLEDRDDPVGVCGGVDGDGKVGNGEVAGEVLHGGDLTVRDDVEGAIGVSQTGGAEGEQLNGTREAGDSDDIADVVLVFDEDEDSVEDVFEDGLSAQANADSDDSGGGKKRFHTHAEDGEHLEQDDEADEAVGGSSEDAGHGTQLRGALGVGNLAVGKPMHTDDEEDDEAPEDKGGKEDDEEVRHVIADEAYDPLVPVMREDASEGIVPLICGDS